MFHPDLVSKVFTYEFPTNAPKVGAVWRNKTLDAYVKIIEVTDMEVTVENTDIGCFKPHPDSIYQQTFGLQAFTSRFRPHPL